MVTAHARAGALLLVAAGAACTDFEDPAVVVDTRIIGMRAEPPEIVVPFDPENPTSVDPADLVPIEVCALVADPVEERGISYTMSLCRPTGDGICDDDVDLAVELGSGHVEDPETSAEAVRMCETIAPGPDLLLVLEDAVSADDLAGFGGIQVQVELRVKPDGGEEQIGFKRVRYSPQLPADRVANTNPSADAIVGLRRASGTRGLDFAMPLGRCGEVEPFEALAGERVQFLPIETTGVREEYVVPTFDGGTRRLVENISYQWLSTAGDWAPFNSGGTIDVAGNEPPLDSIWRAPDDPDEVGDGLDVNVWIVQRDERGGQAWFESCARVLP
jgi:hypothetical protein